MNVVADAAADAIWNAAGNNMGNTTSTNENSGVKNTADSSTGERT